MSYKIVNDDSLISVANAIRTKGGTSGSLVFPSGFVSAVQAIETGGGSGGSGVQTASGTWIAESLSFRQFIINHNLNLDNPKEYTYIIKLAATDKDHVYTANNIFTMGVGILVPTTQRDRDGFKLYNSTAVMHPNGDMTGVLSAWFSGSSAPGAITYILAETKTNNNGHYAEANTLTLGLGLRGCEVGLSYDWELIYFKQ